MRTFLKPYLVLRSLTSHPSSASSEVHSVCSVLGGAVESHSEKHESVSLQQFTNLPHSNYSLCILMQSTLPTPQNTPEPHPKILESGSEPVLSPGPDVALLNPGIHQVHLAAFLKVLLSR